MSECGCFDPKRERMFFAFPLHFIQAHLSTALLSAWLAGSGDIVTCLFYHLNSPNSRNRVCSKPNRGVIYSRNRVCSMGNRGVIYSRNRVCSMGNRGVIYSRNRICSKGNREIVSTVGSAWLYVAVISICLPNTTTLGRQGSLVVRVLD